MPKMDPVQHWNAVFYVPGECLNHNILYPYISVLFSVRAAWEAEKSLLHHSATTKTTILSTFSPKYKPKTCYHTSHYEKN